MHNVSRTAAYAVPVALALCLMVCAFAMIDDVMAADTPDFEDAPSIGADFDWGAVSADAEYKVTDKVTIGSDVDSTIPESTTIYILDGGSLTFEDCTMSFQGTIHAWPGSEVVVSSTGLTLDGKVITEAGSTITLKIDSMGGLTYRAIAPETADDVIFALTEGSIGFSETIIDLDF